MRKATKVQRQNRRHVQNVHRFVAYLGRYDLNCLFKSLLEIVCDGCATQIWEIRKRERACRDRMHTATFCIHNGSYSMNIPKSVVLQRFLVQEVPWRRKKERLNSKIKERLNSDITRAATWGGHDRAEQTEILSSTLHLFLGIQYGFVLKYENKCVRKTMTFRRQIVTSTP